MGGIAGIWQQPAKTPEIALRDNVVAMGHALRHSGAGQAVAVTAVQGIALVQCTPMAGAPLVQNERYTLLCDGALENSAALVAELQVAGQAVGAAQMADSASLMLAAIASWGVAKALPKFSGGFAIALWDEAQQSLTLARDALGRKPLYWSQAQDTLLFGSALRALLAHSACPRQIDSLMLGHYFRHGHVPAPHAIFAGVQKLSPATALTFKAGATLQILRYADMTAAALSPPPLPPDFATATRQLPELLAARLAEQSADTIMLTGGLEGALLAAVAQRGRATPLQSVALRYAAASPLSALAAQLGMRHHERLVGAADALAIVSQLPEIFDEPFADVGQIQTLLLADAAREQGGAALCAAGGAELFLGHAHYRRFVPPVTAPAWMPTWAQRFAARYADAALPETGEVAEQYRAMTSLWLEPERLHPAIPPLPPVLPEPVPDDPAAAMRLWDLLGQLPEGTLLGLERASGAVGLALHMPLLDERMVAFALGLPREYSSTQGNGQVLVRAALAEYAPASLPLVPGETGLPLADWLCDTLRDWAEHGLAEPRLEEAGLDPAPIRALWAQHLAGQGDYLPQLWTALMYVNWRQHWNIYE